jgi:hypothetical protein
LLLTHLSLHYLTSDLVNEHKICHSQKTQMPIWALSTNSVNSGPRVDLLKLALFTREN